MKRRSICWNITSKCNEECKFCYRILTHKENDFRKNKKILKLLTQLSVDKISWTGGEALLYPNLTELLKISKSNGIINNLLTNGKALSIEKLLELEPYLDYITLSYDSNSSNTYKVMGRGERHGINVIEVLDYIQKNNINIKIKINTLVSKLNKDEIVDIGNILNKYKIERWRLFKFVPLRNRAISNSQDFEISNEDFNYVISNVREIHGKNIKISERDEDAIQSEYLLINSVGDFIITDDFKDKIIYNIDGNCIENLQKYLKEE